MTRRVVAERAPARARIHPIQRKRARQYGKPRIEGRMGPSHGLQVCERCEAIYERGSWHARGRAKQPADPTWTLCPACRQVAQGEYFGRIRIQARLEEARELEVRRRVWNVERRARYTNPERRLVLMERVPEGIEILTTSQKLAHRVARELQKAFGGRVRYRWLAGDGRLEASWAPEAGSE